MGRRKVHVDVYRRGDQLVSAHDKTVTVNDAAPTVDRPPAPAVDSPVAAAKTFTFPDPTYRPAAVEESRLRARLRFWFGPLAPTEMRNTVRYTRPVSWHKKLLDPATGKGRIVFFGWPSKRRLGTVRFDRPRVVKLQEAAMGVNYDGADLHGCVFHPPNIEDVSFQGANLSKAAFAKDTSGADRVYAAKTDGAHVTMRDVSFDGADLTGAVLLAYCDRVSFRGAKLDDVEMSVVRVDGPLDFTDSNLSEQQYRDLCRGTPDWADLPETIRYRRYTPTQAAEALGVDDDEMRVMLWAGEFQFYDEYGLPARDGVTFDADLHHIPQWEIQRCAAQRTA